MNDTAKAENSGLPATDAQLNLIRQLCDELGCTPEATEKALNVQSKEAASERIHYLKESKVRDQALRSANQRVNGFDKIVYAMLYKQYVCPHRQAVFADNCATLGIARAMSMELELYNDTAAFVKAMVKEGGQQ